ncbi:MAG: DEAD/DEAH box helicase [Pseudomonadota bacterium]
MSHDPTFSDFALPEALVRVVTARGYEHPTPIQRETLPAMLAGGDVLGQAQTGTGKTAAFALPCLARLDLSSRETQVLVLAPTRELANQVADAFKAYAVHLRGVRVATLCGGQPYRPQLDALRAGAQVVVGTPGRVMDHMRRGSLPLAGLRTLVLDEADEMLRMGFIEDVEWVLEHSPAGRQLALFSATLPEPIRRITERHLDNPSHVAIQARTQTAEGIRQRALVASHMAQKNEALARLLEVEEVDGAIVFVRTKSSTVEVSEHLQTRGYRAAALSGDVDQALRERTVEQLRHGKIDIIVATDVAARGLDVERISHVINYDAPNNAETYIHRIGRTGRAGRSGDAILFVSPRERRLVNALGRVTRHRIEWMDPPSARAINRVRVRRFKAALVKTATEADTAFFKELVADVVEEHGLDPIDAAAALAVTLQGDRPFLARDEHPAPTRKPHARDRERRDHRPERARHGGKAHSAGGRRAPETPLTTYRIEVGAKHQVKPGHIVGAIANEAGLNSRYIGRIAIKDDHSLIDLPGGMPKAILKHLKKVRVAGQQIQIRRAELASAA